MRVFGEKLPMVADFVGFQILWWACILGGAHQVFYPSIIAFVGYVAVHVLFITKRPPRWQGMILLGVSGVLADTLLIQSGILTYPGAGAGFMLTPLWIVILWLGLGFSAQASLSWLMGRPILAFALFGISGAMSYRAGIGFEAASMPISAEIGYPMIGLCFGVIGMALSSGKISLQPVRS